MTSKISCFSGSILRYNVKRFWWIAAVSALVLFLGRPFPILMDRNITETLYYLKDVGLILRRDMISYLMTGFVPVLTAVCVFRYLQGAKNATLFHALPLRRSTLYFSSVLSGWLLFAAPVVLNGLVLLVMSLVKYSAVFTVTNVLQWAGIQLLFGTALYAMTVLIGMFTGSSIAQYLFTYILTFLPAGLIYLIYYLLDGWLFGFESASLSNLLDMVFRVTPFYYFTLLSRYDQLAWWQIVLNLSYIIGFIAIGLPLYKRRGIEHGGDIIAFKWVRPIFLYGVTLCVMLAGSCLIKGIMDTAVPNLLVCLFWAALGYAAAKILLLKSFRIWKYYKGIAVFGGLVILCFVTIHFNLLGFATGTPKPDEVVKAYAGYFQAAGWEDTPTAYGTTQYAVFEEPANIEKIILANQRAIESNQRLGRNDETNRISFAYVTRTGKTIMRTYTTSEDYLPSLLSTDEAKDYMFPNIRKYPERVSSVEFLNNRDGQHVILINAEKDGFLEALNEDISQLEYEELTSSRTKGGIYQANLSLRPAEMNDAARADVYFTFNDSFTTALRWLEEHGYSMTPGGIQRLE